MSRLIYVWYYSGVLFIKKKTLEEKTKQNIALSDIQFGGISVLVDKNSIHSQK